MRGFLCSLLVLLAFYEGVDGQDANCNYYQNVALRQTYYVYSPNYPSSYPRGKTCRWEAVCPANTRCRLNCQEISLPSTTSCSGDRLLVSKIGSQSLTGAEKYCGKGTLNVLSNSNRITIGLITTSSSVGGRFVCSLSAEATVNAPAPVCNCGWKKNMRIVGGQQTQVNEFPMMAGLVDARLRIVFCGATIIATRWVLTAAHCLTGQTPSNVGVLVGEHNTKIVDSSATKLITSQSFIRHPQYSNGYDYDIGLISTSTDIVFSNLVGPACLPFKYASTSFTGVPVETMGWGTQSFAGADSDYLQKVTLNVIDQSQCTRQTGSTPVITSRTLCTYTPGKDSCQHDSGGPVLYQEPSTGREYLLGVVIGGYGCATSKPGLNSRVTEYLSWIQANTPGAGYCNR